MFTGVPYTFHASGFASGWERFVEHPPSSGAPPAVMVITRLPAGFKVVGVSKGGPKVAAKVE